MIILCFHKKALNGTKWILITNSFFFLELIYLNFTLIEPFQQFQEVITEKHIV